MARNVRVTISGTEPFKVELPAELNIQPKFEVRVSKNYVARVYERTETSVVTLKDGTYTEREFKVYRIDVRHDRSGRAWNGWGYDRNYTDLVDVKLALLDIAAALAPKTRTTREESVEDDEE